MPVFVAQDFPLASGTTLPQIGIAWESWGTLTLTGPTLSL